MTECDVVRRLCRALNSTGEERVRSVVIGARDCRIDVLTRLAALNVMDGGDGGLTQLFVQEQAGESDPAMARGSLRLAALAYMGRPVEARDALNP